MLKGTIEFITERLVLRKETLADAEDLYRYLGCEPEIIRYTDWNPYGSMDSTLEKIAEDIKNYSVPGHYAWIITKNGEPIGTIGAYDYKPGQSIIEVGYSIFKPYWGKGYATEALKAVVNYLLLEENIRKICAWSHKDNLASIKVLKKAGFIEKEMDGERITFITVDS